MPFRPPQRRRHRRTSQLASALGRARRQAGALERRLTLLADTTQATGALLDPGMVARFIMEQAATLSGATRFRLYRVDEAGGLLRLDTYREPNRPEAPAEAVPLARGLAGWVARFRKTVAISQPENDARVDLELEWPGRSPKVLVAIPLVSRGRVIGVAELADPRVGFFRADQVGLLTTLMGPAAVALDNSLLFRKLEERTVTDDLTHLYNARFMENYLRRETKRAKRYNHPVALLFIDLDGFKQVNDRYGHMAGSRTLVEVGEVLRRNVREIDIVARWGGDEFSIVLPETGPEGALVMAERVRRKIEEQVFLQDLGVSVRISASIGVAALPEHGHSPESLLAAADTAMYKVKASGKNGVLLATAAVMLQPAGLP